MKYCSRCVMASTRPGITFDENGVCSACQHYEKQKNTDWVERKNELRRICDLFRKPTGYDCIIAISGGKDSHEQVRVMKEEMGMNPILVTVEDNFIMSEAGKHNIANISERFGCHIIALKPDIKGQKKAMRYCFEEYGKPTNYLDVLMYHYPMWMSKLMGIPLLVYGEDTSYFYGGIDDEEKASSLNQFKNGVSSGIPIQELINLGIPKRDLGFFDLPPFDSDLYPIYLSYFIPWNSYRNYILSRNEGFKDLRGEYSRNNHVEDFDQIDSFSYLIHPSMKFPRLGHSQSTDYCSKFIRYGLMTREEAVIKINSMDNTPDNRMIDDFCEFLDMRRSEFWKIYNSHFNMDLFYINEFGEYKLKNPLK